MTSVYSDYEASRAPITSRTCQLTQVFAEARLLEASERRRHVRLVVRVDEDGAGLQPLAHVHGLVDVTGEHA